MLIREYGAQDEERILSLWWHSWHAIRPGLEHPQPFAAWRARWVNEIVPAQTIVVAVDAADTPLGFAAASIPSRELTQIFVAPAHVRRGIGTLLLRWAQAVMPSGFNLQTLVLNEASRAFYRQHGLREREQSISRFNGMQTITYEWSPAHARDTICSTST